MLKKPTSIIAWLILLYFAFQFGFSAVFMGISQYIIPMSMGAMYSFTMVTSTIAMTWYLIHFRHVNISHDKYTQVSLPILGVSIIFILSATYILNLLIEQVGIPNIMEDSFLAMARNPFGALSISLLGPILEELLFRGAIQGKLQEYCKNPWAAIIIASLIFGIIHLNPAQIPFATLLGIMFGWLYFRTGSLLPGIIGHVLNNSIATINMILYGDTPLEEQIQNPLTMWVWALVALIALFISALWLNRNLEKA